MSEPLPVDIKHQEISPEQEREDYLDACAAAEAIDEALRTKEITPLEDFVRELGLETECPR